MIVYRFGEANSFLLFLFYFPFIFLLFHFSLLNSSPLQSEISFFPCLVCSNPRGGQCILGDAGVISNLVGYTYALTYIHILRYKNDGLQRKGQEVDGVPPTT